MNVFHRAWRALRGKSAAENTTGQQQDKTTETGSRANPERAVQYLYDRMQVDANLRAAIVEIRHADKLDGRVKRIHKRMARDSIKGGLQLRWTGDKNTRVINAWNSFVKQLKLRNRQKLLSDARGAVMEGNLALQWVINSRLQVVDAVRMPAETIVPLVDENGRFQDVRKAYRQIDPINWTELCTFPLWQLTVLRLDPDNHDDYGCFGRPYLDASRGVWQKLVMTEEDLVIRRRTRAPQKLAHSLKGADEKAVDKYRQRVESEVGEITTDFYANDLTVTAVAGDANLDQIADVDHLLDTFFSGAPAPKGLFGYVGDMARDILEDLKKDYFEEIDGLQDVLAQAYEQGFRLQLLLMGMNPDAYDFEIQFAERQTSTPNQRADLALKHQAMGLPETLVHEAAGLDTNRVEALRKEEKRNRDPYPEDDYEGDDDQPPTPGQQRISVTPGNAPKGESATSVSNGR